VIDLNFSSPAVSHIYSLILTLSSIDGSGCISINFEQNYAPIVD